MLTGRITRYCVAGCAVRTLIVTSTLLVVSLAIDLAVYMEQVLETADAGSAWASAYELLRYCVLRSADIIARTFGLATFLGVFWWEIRMNRTRERIAIWNTGILPLQSVAAPLLFALMVTSIQISLEFWLRPAAVIEQIRSGYGAYGLDYGDLSSDHVEWFAAGRDLVAARVDKDTSISLDSPIVYRLSENNEIVSVITAARATPSARADTWSMTSLRHWKRDTKTGRLTAGDPLPRTDIALRLDPEWLRYRKIPAKHLPQELILKFAEQDERGTPPEDYKTWSLARYSRSVLPALFVLIASSVSAFSFRQAATLSLFLFFVPCGYLLHLTSKTTILLSEFGQMTPLAAALSPVVFTIIVVTMLRAMTTGTIRRLRSRLRHPFASNDALRAETNN